MNKSFASKQACNLRRPRAENVWMCMNFTGFSHISCKEKLGKIHNQEQIFLHSSIKAFSKISKYDG